jgi:molecular chaperone DnaK
VRPTESDLCVCVCYVQVTFDIDANGIVNVNAIDKQTQKQQTITIQSSGGLSNAEIERMVKDAERNAQDDKKRKELIEVRNSGENMIYSTEKALNEHKAKLNAEIISNIEVRPLLYFTLHVIASVLTRTVCSIVLAV